MAVRYEKIRNGISMGEYVWMDEPADIPGDDPLAQQKKRHAAEIIRRMDASRKWHRTNADDSMDGPRFVMGPDGATTGDGKPIAEVFNTPVADAVVEAMRSGATSVELRTDPEDGSTQVLPTYSSDGAVMKQVGARAIPKKPTQADVRKWAVEQGIEVNPMGQVPKKLIQQYLEAHGG